MKSTIRLIHLVFAAALSVLGTGCGLTMQQRMAAEQFGVATTDFAGITRAEFIHCRQDVIEMNRMRVLLGATNVASLDDPLSLATTQARLRALDALNQYGELLLVLLTTSSAAELQTCADDFVASLNRVQGVRLSPDQAESLGKAVTLGGGLLVEYKRANAMKRVVDLAHPHLTRVIALVERDFDPNDDRWSAGYRRARLDLDSAHRNVPSEVMDDPAGAQLVRAARLAAQENKLRFERVSDNIPDAVQRLRAAEAQLHAAMTSREVSVDDIEDYRAQVNEMRTLFELLRAKPN